MMWPHAALIASMLFFYFDRPAKKIKRRRAVNLTLKGRGLVSPRPLVTYLQLLVWFIRVTGSLSGPSVACFIVNFFCHPGGYMTQIFGQAILDRHKHVIGIAEKRYRGCTCHGGVVCWLCRNQQGQTGVLDFVFVTVEQRLHLVTRRVLE